MAAATAYNASNRTTPYSSQPSSPPGSLPASAVTSPIVNTTSLPSTSAAIDSSAQRAVDSFFDLDWVKNGMPEIMYIKRASRASDRWSAHVRLRPLFAPVWI